MSSQLDGLVLAKQFVIFLPMSIFLPLYWYTTSANNIFGRRTSSRSSNDFAPISVANEAKIAPIAPVARSNASERTQLLPITVHRSQSGPRMLEHGKHTRAMMSPFLISDALNASVYFSTRSRKSAQENFSGICRLFSLALMTAVLLCPLHSMFSAKLSFAPWKNLGKSSIRAMSSIALR